MDEYDLSVIICAHNPRLAYLQRVLEALRTQTLSKTQWELLLIDNASGDPLEPRIDLSWHPSARHIRQEELGLTSARLRGIKESQAELLVFVDDDNVLAANYLSAALELARSYPLVGAFGGSIVGEYETEPPDWAQPQLGSLAIIDVEKEHWALLPGTKSLVAAPAGAGLVIRREAAVYYMERAVNDSLRHGLDRKGMSLISSGDSDMVLCACALGLAIGRFPQLRMTHLIPSARLERNYFLRLHEAQVFSHAILVYIWDARLPVVEQKPCRSERLLRSYQAWRMRLRGEAVKEKKITFEDELNEAARRGLVKALQVLQAHQKALPVGINDKFLEVDFPDADAENQP